MPKFILIDHSLREIGGHHFDYALRILEAADQYGYEIHLAANREFHADQLPSHWHVYPIFAQDIYSQYSMTSSWSSHGKRGLRYVFRKWCQVIGKGAYLRQLATGVREVLATADPVLGDQVFFPGMTEVDLLALQPILATDCRHCGWHFLFHFNFLDGRTPTYASQESSLKSMRKRFRRALRGSASRQLNFYNPTTELSDQYNLLGVAEFHYLGHVVNLGLRRNLASSEVKPLQVTCAGGIRIEKGHRGLSLVVERLWEDYFSTGHLKLVIQANPSRFSIALPHGLSATSCNQQLEYVGHPLSVEAYTALLEKTDIGLMLYDSERYFSRCAGVLVEMLTLGVPVVVPAGCWLAEQITPPIFEHLKLMWQQSTSAHSVALAWERAKETFRVDGVVEVRGPNQVIACTFDRQQKTDTLQIRFRWEHPQQSGTYVQVDVQQFDDAGRVISTRRSIVGRCSLGEVSYTAINLAENTEQIGIQLCNAYDDNPIKLIDVEVQQDMTHAAPLGKVGMIATDSESFAAMLAEITENYSHYQHSAEEFSKSWSRLHDPARTIERLVERSNAM